MVLSSDLAVVGLDHSITPTKRKREVSFRAAFRDLREKKRLKTAPKVPSVIKYLLVTEMTRAVAFRPDLTAGPQSSH